MKAKLFFAAVLFFLPEIIFSQEVPVTLKNSYWNLNFSYGIGSSITNTGGGESYTIEASYIPKNNIGFYTNYSNTTFSPDVLNSENGTTKIYQFISGARFYTNNKKFYLSTGLGYYNLRNFNDYYLIERVESKQVLCLNLGIGTRIKTGASYGFVINGNFTQTLSNRSNDILLGLSAGFEVNNNSQLSYVKKDKKFSSGVLVGSLSNSTGYRGINNNTVNKSYPSYGIEATYRLSDQFSITGNFLHTNSDYAVYFSNSQNDVACGIRYYTGQNGLKFFVEGLTDLRFQKYTSRDYLFETEELTIFSNSLGLAFAAGAEFEILNNFSGMFKANVIKFDENGSATGIYGGLKFGI